MFHVLRVAILVEKAKTYSPRSLGRGCAESCPTVPRVTGPQSTWYSAFLLTMCLCEALGHNLFKRSLLNCLVASEWFCILSENRSAVASSIIVYSKWLFGQGNIYPVVASAMVFWRSGITRSLFEESLKWVMFPQIKSEITVSEMYWVFCTCVCMDFFF